jgi:hypothetical protein
VRCGASWCRKAAGTGNHGKKTTCSIAVIVDTLGHGEKWSGIGILIIISVCHLVFPYGWIYTCVYNIY